MDRAEADRPRRGPYLTSDLASGSASVRYTSASPLARPQYANLSRGRDGVEAETEIWRGRDGVETEPDLAVPARSVSITNYLLVIWNILRVRRCRLTWVQEAEAGRPRPGTHGPRTVVRGPVGYPRTTVLGYMARVHRAATARCTRPAQRVHCTRCRVNRPSRHGRPDTASRPLAFGLSASLRLWTSSRPRLDSVLILMQTPNQG